MSSRLSKFALAFHAQEVAEKLAAKQRVVLSSGDDGAERRREGRCEVYEPTAVLLGVDEKAIAILDLSAHGALVHIQEGLGQEARHGLSIRLCDNIHLHGSAAWIGNDRLGFKFDRYHPDIADLFHLEHRAEAAYRAMVKRQKTLVAAVKPLGLNGGSPGPAVWNPRGYNRAR